MIEELFLAIGVAMAIAIFFLFCWLNKLADEERSERLRQCEEDIKAMKAQSDRDRDIANHQRLANFEGADTYDKIARVPSESEEPSACMTQDKIDDDEPAKAPVPAESVTELVAETAETRKESQASDLERELEAQMRSWRA